MRSGAQRSLAAALDASGTARWHAVAEPGLEPPGRPEAGSVTAAGCAKRNLQGCLAASVRRRGREWRGNIET